MRIVATVMLGLSLALPAAASGEALPLSKLEARRLSPEATKRRVLDQLGDILAESPRPKNGPRPVRPLSHLWFWTRAHATDQRGLCAADQLLVTFRAVGPDSGATTPMRARGVTASTYYRFLALPHRSDSGLDEDAQAAQDGQCARLSPNDPDFFAAERVEDAVEAGVVVAEMPATLADPRLALDCDLLPRAKPEACRDALRALRIEQVTQVTDCGDGREPDDRVCIVIEASTQAAWLRITAARAARGQGEITRLRVSEEIIIADELID